MTMNGFQARVSKAVLALAMACTAWGSAQAGVVTGDFDPVFGPGLPGYSYGGDFSFNFDSSWINSAGAVNANGHRVLNIADVTASPLILNSRIALCLTAAAPCSTATAVAWDSSSANITQLTFDAATGLVVDWASNTANPGALANINYYSREQLGWDAGFEFSWDSLTGGPSFYCVDENCYPPFGPRVEAGLDGLKVEYVQKTTGDVVVGQVKSTYAADPNQPGVVIRTTVLSPTPDANLVPEPGSLALVLASLGAAALVRRRKP